MIPRIKFFSIDAVAGTTVLLISGSRKAGFSAKLERFVEIGRFEANFVEGLRPAKQKNRTESEPARAIVDLFTDGPIAAVLSGGGLRKPANLLEQLARLALDAYHRNAMLLLCHNCYHELRG